MRNAISETSSPIQIRAMVWGERLSVVGIGQAEFADIFLKCFTGDTLGATQIPERREAELNQFASQGMREPPWPPIVPNKQLIILITIDNE